MNFQSYLKSMDDRIDKLKAEIKANPCESKEKAKQSLIASGVFNEDGTPKSRICDAEHTAP